MLIALAGCAREGPRCYPVSGQVLLDEKPLPDAMIVLHPTSGEVDGGQKPIAHSDALGKFVVTTYRGADGAPAGSYNITVVRRALRKVGEEDTRNGPNELPPLYADAKTTTLKCQIGEQVNLLDPLRLSRRPR